MTEDKVYIYFLGIGGVGMSALALWFKSRGRTVMGYDRYPSATTTRLELEGISINYHDSEHELPQLLTLSENKSRTLVVITPAIPSDSRQLGYFRHHGFDIRKRAQVLGESCRGMFTIAVAGTHGKTTTSTMVAHLLTQSGYGCNAFLGGFSVNYDSNLLLNSQSKTAVVEADEFDRSFLHLSPDLAIITSTDPDHLDIYGNANEVTKSFRDFAGRIVAGGTLLVKEGLNILNPSGDTHTYGVECGEFSGSNLTRQGLSTTFDLFRSSSLIGQFALTMPGRHNVENAVGALAAAHLKGINADLTSEALASFRGVRRRWEIIHQSDQIVFVDDYAHHPAELEAAIGAARVHFPGWPVIAFFQPHLFTRTRDFIEDFARVLSKLDVCYLLPIYPAREAPIDGITSEYLLSLMTGQGHLTVRPADVPALVGTFKEGILMTLGAGDIDLLVPTIRDVLKTNMTIS